MADSGTAFLEGLIPSYVGGLAQKKQRSQKAAADADATRFKTALELAKSLSRQDLVAGYVQSGSPESLYAGLTPDAALQAARKKTAAEANEGLFKSLLQADQYDAARSQGVEAGLKPEIAGRIGPNARERAATSASDELAAQRRQETQVKAQRLLNLQRDLELKNLSIQTARARLDKLNDDAVQLFGMGGVRKDNIGRLVSELNTSDVFLQRQLEELEETKEKFIVQIEDELAAAQQVFPSEEAMLASPDISPETMQGLNAIQDKIRQIQRERDYANQMMQRIMGIRRQQTGTVPEDFRQKARAFLAANGMPTSDAAVLRVFRHPEHRLLVEQMQNPMQFQQFEGPLRPDGMY